jgi:hypothetical protein
MIYKMSKKIVGTNTFETIANFQTETPIIDICWVNDFGVVFSYGKYLGALDNDGEVVVKWIGSDGEPKDGDKPSFGFLSGLSYSNKFKTLFVAEDAGRNIRAIDLNNNYTSSLIKKVNYKNTCNILKKTPMDFPAWIAGIGRSNVFIAYPSLKKCYLWKSDSFYHIAGDGIARFSNGDKAITSSIGVPSCISFYDGSLLILDSLTGVIRSLSGQDVGLFAGCPKEKTFGKPRKMTIHNESLYVLGENSIRAYLIHKKVCAESAIYESDHIIDIVADDHNGLYILERTDADS